MKRHLLIFTGAFFVLALSGVAWAHAFPKTTQPAKNAVVAHAPDHVVIHFSGLLAPVFNKLVVSDDAGDVVSVGKAAVSPDNHAVLSVKVKPLPAGTYHVKWQANSKDGHQTHGQYSFRVTGEN